MDNLKLKGNSIFKFSYFYKIHLFTYIHLMKFLENPERDWRKKEVNIEQLTLF